MLMEPREWSFTFLRIKSKAASLGLGELRDDELQEAKLVHAKRWIVKWGLVFTVVIVVLWPALSVPAGRSGSGGLLWRH